MSGKPKHIELKSDKKGVFAKAAHAVLYENRSRVGGNDKYIVKLAVDEMKARGITNLSAVTVDEMKEALAAIVARHKPQEGEDDERVDVRDYVDDQAVEAWNGKEWQGQGHASDLLEAIKAAGYGPENRAPKSFVASFFADAVAKLAKTDDGPEGTCSLASSIETVDGKQVTVNRCTSIPGFKFTPVAQNIVLRDGSLLRHESGELGPKDGQPGTPIRTGQFMVDHEAQKVIGPVCPRDVTAIRRLRDKDGNPLGVKFYDRAGAERVLAGIQKRVEANAGLAEIAGNAVRRRRPPVQSGARNMPGQWTSRRNRGGR